MRTLYFYLILFLCFNLTSFSQVQLQWEARYHGTADGSNSSSFAAIDKNQNIIVTGSGWGAGTMNDIIIIKFLPDGTRQWVQRYNGFNRNDYVKSLVLDDSNNIYITGSSEGINSHDDIITVKYSQGGELQWVQRYNGTADGWDEAHDIAIDHNRNIYITGFCAMLGGNNNNDYITIKYNSDGLMLWKNRFDGSVNGYDYANALVVDTHGNVYVTGGSENLVYNEKVTTIKYNSSGVQQWVRLYSIYNYGVGDGTDIVFDRSGNILVCGSTGNNAPQYYFTLKYDTNGTQLWSSNYQGSGGYYNGATAMVIDNYNYVYVAGWAYYGGYGTAFGTLKYAPDGTQIWARSYVESGNGGPSSITMDSSYNFYITGELGDFHNDSIITLKYNQNGDQIWCAKYKRPGNGNDGGKKVLVDSSYNIYVAGFSTVSIENSDLILLKYSQILQIKNETNVINNFSLSQNYPNPFNPSTNIKFSVPQKSFVKITIYNSIGQEITKLIDEELSPGTYESTWDASNYPSGIYYYKLESETFTGSKKMILIR